MTKDDILKLALEVEFGYCEEYIGNKSSPCRKEIVRFAALLEAKVRADERNACAALCSEVAAGKDAEAIEEAILARGEK